MLTFGRVFVATTVLFSVCLAALLAHVGIDFAGNMILSHDAYDDVRHVSRAGVVAFEALVALGSVVSALSLAALELQSGNAQLRAILRRSVGRAPAGFVLRVVAGSLVALPAMECFDTLARDGNVAGLADLLGGSLALGLAITVACAGAVALGVWNAMHLLLRSCRALVAALGALILRLERGGDGKRAYRVSPVVTGSHALPILSTNAGKRAPPVRV